MVVIQKNMVHINIILWKTNYMYIVFPSAFYKFSSSDILKQGILTSLK